MTDDKRWAKELEAARLRFANDGDRDALMRVVKRARDEIDASITAEEEGIRAYVREAWRKAAN